MKTFRMIGMALLAILLSVNLVSCDKDEDGTTGGGSGAATGSGVSLGNGKKLVRMMEYSVRDEVQELKSMTELKYDAQGRVIEAKKKKKDDEGSWKPDNAKISWESNKVTLSFESYEDEYFTYMLSGGKISKGSYSYWSEDDSEWYTRGGNFIYDKDGHIKETFEEGGNGEKVALTSFIWNNDRLSLIDDGYYSYNFRYDGQTCNGFNPMLYLLYGGNDYYIFIAHPELVGLETTHLPSKCFNSLGSMTTLLEYELDSDGYVIGCTTCRGNEYYSETRYYEFAWE